MGKNCLKTVKVLARVEGVDWSIINENMKVFLPCIPKVDRHNWKKAMKQFLESEICMKRQKESSQTVMRLHHNFYAACKDGRIDILENLEKQPFFEFSFIDSHGLTALDHAVIHNQDEVVHWLLQRINIMLWYTHVSDGIFINNSPVYYAVEYDSYAAYEALEP